MRTITYVLFFLFTINLTFSQSFFDAGLPTITPTSPEAAGMGRYGNLPINQATGRMSYSIPIHTIQVGGNSWPISLEYNYGGFILEGKPSLSGLGWALSVNGAVTREIRGLADGHTNGYYGDGQVKDIIAQYVANEAQQEGSGFTNMSWFNLREGFYKGAYDSEVDKYNVNVGGINFSFKIDANKQPVYLSKHNYKVAINWVSGSGVYAVNSFTVTDDTGVQYYFSDKENYVGATDEDLTEFDIGLDKTTSWNLSKLTYLNGQEINFNYTPDSFISYDFSASGLSLTGDVQQGFPNDGMLLIDSAYDDKMRKSTLDRRILTSISFPSGTIYLYTTTINNRKVYNSIVVKNSLGSTVNDFDLTYLGNRDALIKVTKNNQTLFDFEYFGITTTNSLLPDFYTDLIRKPLDQDNWKYYNGAQNTYAVSVPGSAFIAYKEPDFTSTRLGALKKIIYPTGGYTTISYEQNSVKNVYTSASVNNNSIAFNREILVKLNSTSTNGEREAKLTYTFNQPVVATISHLLNGRLWGNEPSLTIKRLDPTTGSQIVCPDLYPNLQPLVGDYDDHVDFIRDLLAEPIPLLCPRLTIALGPDGDAPGSLVPVPNVSLIGSTNGRIIIDAGRYEFRVALDDLDNVIEESIYGEIKVQFYEPENTTGGGTLYINENVGGIRVGKLTDYSEAGVATAQHFDYNDEVDNLSSAVLNQIPLKNVTHSWWVHLDPSNGGSYYYEVDTHRLNAYTGINASHGNPLYYTKIKSYNTIVFSSQSDTGSGGDSGGVEDGNEDGSPGHNEGSGDPVIVPDENPDNSARVTILGSQPIPDDSYIFPHGYTLTEYEAPFEDSSFDYAGRPTGEDLSKTKLIGNSAYGFIADQPYSLKSITTNDYSMVRDLLVQNNGGDDPDQDANPNHPLSFKVLKKQHLTINDPNNYSENPSTQVQIDNVKSLYQIFEYKELNASHRVNKQTASVNGVQQITDYIYDTNDRLKETITTDSEDNTLKTINFYADDITNNDDYELMLSTNRVSEVVKKESYFNNEITATQQTLYDDRWTSNSLPEYISTAKGIITSSNPLKERITYHKYDDFGNPLEVSQVSGTSISYIWGYNRQFPVAKIENATRAQIEALSGFGPDFDSGTGGLTSTQDNTLRSNLPNALITTYTYIPLIGVSTITDPRGRKLNYHYDSLNRLEKVTDHELNIVSKNEYHYKDQQ